MSQGGEYQVADRSETVGPAARDRYVAEKPEDYVGGPQLGTGECVAFVQRTAGAPLTRYWSAGPKVSDTPDLRRGTAIAIFDDTGRYANNTNQTSHAAIYLSQDQGGIWVVDQFNTRDATGAIVVRRSPARRYLRFGADNKATVDNASHYRIIQ